VHTTDLAMRLFEKHPTTLAIARNEDHLTTLHIKNHVRVENGFFLCAKLKLDII